MAEAKIWGARLVAEPKRPLRTMTRRELQADDAIVRVRDHFGLETMGEARDLIGAELRKRTRETVW